jgi:hypothetical protein
MCEMGFLFHPPHLANVEVLLLRHVGEHALCAPLINAMLVLRKASVS